MSGAGVPDDVEFATKPALAQAMICDALAAGVRAAWVAGDEVYGADSKLRRQLRRAGQIVTGIGARRAVDLAVRLPKRSWQRLSAGRGSKGERWYDWALVQTTDEAADPVATSTGHHWLLIRRNLKTGEYAFYRAYSPTQVTVATLVKVAGRRWTIEESFAASKELAALDEHQVRTWTSWQRWRDRAGDPGPRVPVRDGCHPTSTGGRADPDPVDPQRDPPAPGRRDRTSAQHRTHPQLVDLAPATPSPSPHQPLRPTSHLRRMITKCRCRTSPLGSTGDDAGRGHP